MNRRAQRGKYTRDTTTCCDCTTACPCRNIGAAQAGFTVVEVMVAVIIFAVGLAAIAGMQTRSIAQSTFSDQMTMRVNALTHWAESLKRMPVMDENLAIDGGVTIDVEVNPLFDEENMCEYGKTCDWSYVDYEEDTHPHRLRRRITQDYPLPNLVMIELSVSPQGVSAKTAERRTASIAYVRSTRWN